MIPESKTSTEGQPPQPETINLAGVSKKKTIWRWITLLALIVILPFLFLYNLELNPRPWHDEGAILSVPKTLVVDGIYGSRNLDKYDYFGPIQSVGPTVLLPIALSFKWFGVGLVQGRVVVAIYSIITVLLVYLCGVKLAGKRMGLVSTLLLLGSPIAGVILYGRQAFGEIPALGFFLAGWLLWSHARKSPNIIFTIISGLMFGLANVTKSQYLPVVLGICVTLLFLDLTYFHEKLYKSLGIIGLIALLCYLFWQSWQYFYFGPTIYAENIMKLQQLFRATIGFDISMVLSAFKTILGNRADYFYYFWGIPSIFYIVSICIQRKQNSAEWTFLLLFVILWFAYYFLRIPPWPQSAYASFAVVALFVGQFWYVITGNFSINIRRFIRDNVSGKFTNSLSNAYLLLVVIPILIFPLVDNITDYVISRDRSEDPYGLNPPQLLIPYEVASYLQENYNSNTVIETWDRELSILSNHIYHFPDSSILASTNETLSTNSESKYLYSVDYFRGLPTDLVIIGWFSRLYKVYDSDFLSDYGRLIATFGQGGWRYDIYQLPDKNN